MVEGTAVSGEYKDLDHVSKVRPDLMVIGTEKKEVFEKQLADAKAAGMKVIGTHSGAFHCDEVFASVMLLYTKDYANSIIVRTRDEEIVDRLDIVCDVGSIYDPAKLRFDHHQKTFTDVWSDDEKYKLIRLSSAGLIYRHFGKEVLTNLVKEIWGQDLT